MKVEFYKHNVGDEERKNVDEVLQSIFLTTGPKTNEFEAKFAEYLGVKFALGFQSWTSAAFMVLMAWGIGEGDEVIVPSLSFIASANIAVLNGAKVIFCDSDPKTGNMDINHFESLITERTKAVVPVHLYGHLVDMKALRKICDNHDIKILEDSAHNIEGTRDGIRPGQLGDAACFSFYATKNITCGEGGAVVTNDPELENKLRLIRTHGMSKSAADRYTAKYKHWNMEALGFKGNMNDIQAAMLLPQLRKIDDVLVRKEEICSYYESRFEKAGIEFPQTLEGTKSGRHLFTFWAPEDRRDEFLTKLQDKGIGVAVNFRAIHTLQWYQEYLEAEPNLPIATSIGRRTITIPMYPSLTDEEVEYVANSVVELFSE